MNSILRTRRLELTPINSNHIRTLWEWRNSSDFKNLCTMRKTDVSMAEFIEELRADFNKDRFCQMIIRLKKNSYTREIGTIFSYGLNRYHGHAFVTTFIAPGFQDRGYGAEAFAVFVWNMFEIVPELHKVYADVYSVNKKSIACLRHAGFIQEGCFVEHSVVNGERCDLLRFAMFRKYLLGAQRFLVRIGVKSETPIVFEI